MSIWGSLGERLEKVEISKTYNNEFGVTLLRDGSLRYHTPISAYSVARITKLAAQAGLEYEPPSTIMSFVIPGVIYSDWEGTG